MLDDIYNKRILEFAGNIPRLGRLPQPDASATAHSRLCGSTVTVDLEMDGDVVTDFAHDVKACALGQASSSIMARNIVGAHAAELREVRETMRKMLKENGPPPEGRFADLEFLEPVRDYKARHASTMLTFDAVVDAIGQIEAKRAGISRDLTGADGSHAPGSSGRDASLQSVGDAGARRLRKRNCRDYLRDGETGILPSHRRQASLAFELAAIEE